MVSKKADELMKPGTVDTDEQLVIQNTTRRMYMLQTVKGTDFKVVRLLPGQTNVDPKQWEALKDTKYLKKAKATGALRNLGLGKALRLDKGLDGLTPDKARAQIAKTDDVGLLNKYRAQTKVDEYHSLIEERISDLVANA